MRVFREELSAAMKREDWALTACHWKQDGKIAHAHWHEAYEILYIRRGRIAQTINAERPEAGEGDVVIVRPSDIHGTDCLSPDGCDIDVLQFTAEKADGEGLLSGVVRPDEDIAALMDYLWDVKESDRPGRALLTAGLIQTLCGVLWPYSSSVKRKYPPDIEAVRAYLKQADDRRLETAAARFGYSPEHLSRKFRQAVGISYRGYCEQLCMRRAIVLLSDETLPLTAVSEQLGYSDSGCFIRAFRRAYGITPGAYRKRRRGLDG